MPSAIMRDAPCHIISLSQATICLAFLERLLERVALRVRVGDAVRLRVRVLVGDALAAR